MAISKIQRGDKVIVTTGKYKNTTGVVTGIYTKNKGNKTLKRVTVSGLPATTRYQRSAKFMGYPGQIYSGERSVDISNVALVNDKGVASKVKIEKKDGVKTRILKKDDSVVKYNRLEKKSRAELEKEYNEMQSADKTEENSKPEKEPPVKKEPTKEEPNIHTYTLDVKPSMLGPEISELLEANKIIKDAEKFNRYLELEGYAPYIQLGKQKLTSDMSNFEIAEKIAKKN